MGAQILRDNGVGGLTNLSGGFSLIFSKSSFNKLKKRLDRIVLYQLNKPHVADTRARISVDGVLHFGSDAVEV